MEVIHAGDDAITQSQQLLKIIQSRSELRPYAFLVEPVTGAGLHRVAQAAVADGIAWVISNCAVDYIQQSVKTQKLQYLLLLRDKRKLADYKADRLPHFCPRVLPSYTSRDQARVLFLHSDERAWRPPSHGIYG